MRPALHILFSVLFLAAACGSASAIGPADLVDLANPAVLTPADLASEIAAAAGINVVPGTVLFTGAATAAGTFRNANADGIGNAATRAVNGGVILTTGDVFHAVGPNVLGQEGTANFLGGDAALTALAGQATFDATVLEFDFTTPASTVTFTYVFASDEYVESTNNDVFGLFVDGVNIALTPAPQNPVTISTLNGAATPGLFVNNDVEVIVPPFATQYDGFTRVMTAAATIAPNAAHHVKFAIGDAGDDLVDSAVFIQGTAASFADVPPAHFAFTHVEAVFAAGITAGCAPRQYCPDQPVTRGQMAVFIETSLGRPAAACTGGVFADVNASVMSPVFCGFIERLAADGITGGCGGGLYCPNQPVTRGQMAVFIERALGKTPAVCNGTLFNDVTSTSLGPGFCAFIEQLAADGITGGCAPGFYCPNDVVTRAQMAVFLVAAPHPLLP